MKSKFKRVNLAELTKAFGPEMMDMMAEGLHTAVHQDATQPKGGDTVDLPVKKKATTPGLTFDVKPKRRTY